MSATGRIVGGSAQSVMRWLRKLNDNFISEKHDISGVKEIEMDEMYRCY